MQKECIVKRIAKFTMKLAFIMMLKKKHGIMSSAIKIVTGGNKWEGLNNG